MSLTYNSYLSQIATLTAISSSTLANGDGNFGGIFPAVIDYAEGRLYRDLDLPAARATVDTVLSSGVYFVVLPSSVTTLLVIEQVVVITPAGALSSGVLSSAAVLNPLVAVSQDWLDAIYPEASNFGVPQYFSRFQDQPNVAAGGPVLVFGPAPDQAYGLRVRGTSRPTALSSANTSTWLSNNTPELMICAGMVFMSGHMRDFGAQSDNPQMSQSWENQYNTLKGTMNIDSLRMKFQSQGWTQQVPNPIATPPRA